MFDIIDTSPLHFAIALATAFVWVLGFMWCLCRAAAKTEQAEPRLRLVGETSPDENQKILPTGTAHPFRRPEGQ
jgi:hypothetical protein